MINAFQSYIKNLQDTYSKNATELTYRTALENLLNESAKIKISAGKSKAPVFHITHEPKRHQDGFGAPDFMVKQAGMIVGYVENKAIGKNLDDILKSEQIKKYQKLTNNLLVTNYLEWIWLHNGVITRENLCYLTDLESRKFKPNPEKITAVGKLLDGFFSTTPQQIGRAKELAQELSVRTRLLRDYLEEELKRQQQEDQQGKLHGLYQVFQKTISSALDLSEFADAFAQTLSYGLFLAKLNAGQNTAVTLSNAKEHISNNFELIRELVSFLDELKQPQYANTRWLVEEILGLLNALDLTAIQEDLSFSKKQGRLFKESEEERLLFAKDPYVYFYEDFLKAYDQETRKSRGIYYTPPPVVNFIVRAIQDILKDSFGIKEGLADHNRVTLLDFATGTGTFLIEVLQQIFEHTSPAKHHAIIKEHILKNIYGFEYLIAPYTIAHLKLSQFLRDKGYEMQAGERLQIYLANTLENPEEAIQKDWLVPALTQEAEQAQEIKRKKKILVITGNPPYSGHSQNKGQWITDLLRGKEKHNNPSTSANYFALDGNPLGEKNPKWLQDDYVKFIRFAQWKIDQVSEGVVGIITNHSFLDNPTFRGMRQSLLKSFNQIYILDLHGNAKKKEKSPDGGKDENVFDIEQGVTISLFIKSKSKKTGIYYADLWGKRQHKYRQLTEMDLNTTAWQAINPSTPFYFLIPQDEKLRDIYDQGWKVPDIFPLNSVGIVTARDHLAIQFDSADIQKIIKDFSRLDVETAREKYQLGSDSRDWLVKLAQQDLLNSGLKNQNIIPITYRPFDQRHTYYTGKSRGFHCMPRPDIMPHMLAGENVGLLVTRLNRQVSNNYFFSTEKIVDFHILDNAQDSTSLFPLYLYPSSKDLPRKPAGLFDHDQPVETLGRQENISPAFRQALHQHYQKHYSPEEILGYIYAILHSPIYRHRYKGFLKSDFPRIPLVKTPDIFEELSMLGWQLVQAHLMREIPDHPNITISPGDYLVEKPLYLAEKQRLHINKTLYVEPVSPEVWNFHIGGYQVLDKYLKSRLGRTLNLDEITNIENIIKVLNFTLGQMQKIEALSAI